MQITEATFLDKYNCKSDCWFSHHPGSQPCGNSAKLNLEYIEILYSNHEFSNPFTFEFEKVRRSSRLFVADCEGDPMTDRSREFVRKLKFLNVSVVHIFNPGDFHGLEMYNKTDALALFEAVKNFIYSTRGAEVEVSRASY
ncbi:unnamed protein product [Fraxinus pennsylvanica]|uniref:Alpha/beta hydrolase fold-3 domain-containing protein n=1 Tax=Fraxinus pennsylvanica TaxID=56036 RepID=A0AAD1YQC9_9LAMI|nr:unnamed protein product [Fraxinus pennsylvanica]